VSLGYLSEIERGQKEASSELLAAICDALGARLSEVLREASDMLALAEQMDGVLTPVGTERRVATVGDGEISVAVHRTGPLQTTLRATLAAERGREVVRAA
jgi:transcriptional regulator with XRE-family HTH domain